MLLGNMRTSKEHFSTILLMENLGENNVICEYFMEKYWKIQNTWLKVPGVTISKPFRVEC